VAGSGRAAGGAVAVRAAAGHESTPTARPALYR
jgi:hypothetical protein